jgi:hypothetical protein
MRRTTVNIFIILSALLMSVGVYSADADADADVVNPVFQSHITRAKTLKSLKEDSTKYLPYEPNGEKRSDDKERNAYPSRAGQQGQEQEQEQGQTNPASWHSSDIGINCEKLTIGGDWSKYANMNEPTQIWNFTSGSESAEGEEQPDRSQQFIECHAFMMLTDPSQYGVGEDQRNPGSSFETTSAGQINCLDEDTDQKREECKEQIGPTKCVHNGFETHDYQACKNMLQYSDGFFVAKQGLETGHTVQTQAFVADSNNQMQQEVANGNDLGAPTLKVGSNSKKMQADQANMRGALQGAKAAALMTKVQGFPTKEKMIAKCASNFTAQHYTSIINATGGEEGNFDPQQACGNAFAKSDFLLLNQEVADEMKAVATQASMEGLADLAKALLLASMAKQVDDTIAEIEEFQPPEFQEVEPPKISECLVDPTIAGCPQTTVAGYQGFAGQNFNSNIGAQNVENLGSPNYEEDSASNAAAGDRSLLPQNFGTVAAGIARDGSFVDGIVAPGSLKKGTGGAASGGGGGGGGGNAAPPGRAPAAEQKAASPSGITSSKVKTVGDGMGSIGGRGRVGIARKPKSKNPFGNLLGKNKKPRNGQINFRSLASTKGKQSVLEMISKRYHSIMPDKNRLMQYEQKTTK